MTDQLPDIPDLTGIAPEEVAPWADGWYKGTIVGRREFTDRNGNDRVFESADEPAQAGDSRNIRLQAQIVRGSDNRTMNTSVLVNYRPEDFQPEQVAAIAEKREEMKKDPDADWGELFRPFKTLERIGTLQRIAEVRSFQQNGSGLDLAPLFGKTAYFKLAQDKRNPQYKQVVAFREDAPKAAAVL